MVLDRVLHSIGPFFFFVTSALPSTMSEYSLVHEVVLMLLLVLWVLRLMLRLWVLRLMLRLWVLLVLLNRKATVLRLFLVVVLVHGVVLVVLLCWLR